MAQKYGLGRGLSSLIPQKNKAQNTQIKPTISRKSDNVSIHAEKNIRPQIIGGQGSDSGFIEDVPIGMLRANKEQPRMHFDEEKLSELSNPIT